MKKIVFTFLTMVVFAFVANTTFAQTNTTPYQGSTYSYSLGGIYSVDGATINIEYLTGDGATISDISPATIPAGVATTLTFNVAYSSTATEGEIRVTLTEDVTDGCSNFIDLAITPQAQPVLVLNITASELDPICQDINSNPEDNTPASSEVTSNSFTFTVEPTITNVSAQYGYVYSINITPVTSSLTNYSIAYTGSGTYDSNDGTVTKGVDTTDDVFTITFQTTTGVADEITTSTISAATLTVTNTSGGGDYTGTFTNDEASVTVKTLPSIGSFSIE
jgi:hypothetical protein